MKFRMGIGGQLLNKIFAITIGFFLIASNGFPTAFSGISEPLLSDLSIDKEADKTNAQPGEALVYTLWATNNGPDDAFDVFIEDLLPAEVIFVSVNSEIPDCNFNQLEKSVFCGIPLLLAEENYKIEITVMVNEETLPDTTLINLARIYSDRIEDSNLENNFSSTEVSVFVQDAKKKDCHCFQVDVGLKKIDYEGKKKLPKSKPSIPKSFGEENPRVIITKSTDKQIVDIIHVWKKKVHCEGDKKICVGQVEVFFEHEFNQGEKDITKNLKEDKVGMVKKFSSVIKAPQDTQFETKKGKETTKECKGNCGEELPPPDVKDFVEDVNFATKYRVVVPNTESFDADLTIGLIIKCPDGINDGSVNAFGHAIIEDGKYIKEKSAHK